MTGNATKIEIAWQQWLKFLTPEGQQQIVEFVAEARDTRGANWLPELKAEFPFASWILELVATKTADQALDEIARTYPLIPVKFLAGDKIINLHGLLLAEIERKR